MGCNHGGVLSDKQLYSGVSPAVFWQATRLIILCALVQNVRSRKPLVCTNWIWEVELAHQGIAPDGNYEPALTHRRGPKLFRIQNFVSDNITKLFEAGDNAFGDRLELLVGLEEGCVFKMGKRGFLALMKRRDLRIRRPTFLLPLSPSRLPAGLKSWHGGDHV